MKIKYYLIAFLIICPTTLFSQSKKTIIFNTQDIPPYAYMENNRVSGPTVEIIKEVCKQTKIIAPQFNLLPWKRSQAEVKHKLAHALFVIGRNIERDKWLYYTLPIYEVEYGFFVTTDNKLKYKRLQDLKGYTVGVFGPSNTSFTLKQLHKKYSQFNIDMSYDDIEVFKNLSVKRLDAAFSNKDVGYAYINKFKLANIKYAGFHKKLKYYIGFNKESCDKKTVELFNKKYKLLYKKRVIHKILKKYKLKPAKLK